MSGWRNLAALLVGFALMACQGAPKAQLRTDGLYQSVEDDSSGGERYWSYLRFNPDGEVLCVSSTGTPDQISTWFRADHPEGNFSRGKLIMAKDLMTFTCASAKGSVEYSGRFYGDKLVLDTISGINGKLGLNTYRFVAGK